MNQQVQTSIPRDENAYASSNRDTWIDPALGEWTRRNAVMARRFSVDLAGSDQSASVYFGLVVQITGDYIWTTSHSKPDWAQLDVDGLQLEILQERLRLDDIATGNFNISLTAYYTFLFRTGHLAKEATIRIVQRLEEYDNAYVSETIAYTKKKPYASRVKSIQSSLLHRRTLAYASTR